MKLATFLALSSLSSAAAFAPSMGPARSFALKNQLGNNMDTSGNAWKPDSEKMGSTDTGDYFPEGYDPAAQPGFSDGMYGSQQMLDGGNRSGPQLPGMENLGADAVMMGGIEENSEIPAGMEFTPATRPDGEYSFQVAASSKGGQLEIEIKPFCMGFEDYYAAFAPGSHPSLSVSPCAGRMDRRGGESTFMTIACNPAGQAGTFTGDLVVNLPEDMSKLSYKVSVVSF
ncbi:hypothetical protein CTEN210_00289 [Chaetoceros tenuissimus]|uniref:Uncharacterized protein n=1 Tax=Chaetoceros tenuissimus TaxID=426638 RepID=A0AAD3GYJ7_9STRA|nr:hypothetical protein CTEN210_00289 [Chaetoceros tenuissimus]